MKKKKVNKTCTTRFMEIFEPVTFFHLLTKHWSQLRPVTSRLQKQSPLTGSHCELPDTVPLRSQRQAGGLESVRETWVSLTTSTCGQLRMCAVTHAGSHERCLHSGRRSRSCTCHSAGLPRWPCSGTDLPSCRAPGRCGCRTFLHSLSRPDRNHKL